MTATKLTVPRPALSTRYSYSILARSSEDTAGVRSSHYLHHFHVFRREKDRVNVWVAAILELGISRTGVRRRAWSVRVLATGYDNTGDSTTSGIP